MAQKKADVFGEERAREEILGMLKRNPVVYARFLELTWELQEDLIGFCMGNKGLKVTLDPFFKAVFDPEVYGERLSKLLSAILQQKVTVKRAVPNESSRLTAGGSLLIMDILVELESGGLANVEMQKIGYVFPGERGACYSADLVLRQYARVKEEKKKKFVYRDMKKVFTVVLMEQSGKEFKAHKGAYRHHARQTFDTDLELELLQEYVYIPLDIFLDIYRQNGQNIDKELDAWLLFLASDDPEDILRLIQAYPEFRELYEDIMAFQQRPEELVNMYSKALEIMDRNTVEYMIEEQKREIEENKKEIEENKKEIEENKKEIEEQARLLAEKDAQLELLRKKLAEAEAHGSK